MKKIPTIFERDWKGDKSRVINEPNPAASWVFAGEGIATRKIDGTCCMVRGNRLFKRRELRESDATPPGFELAERDTLTQKVVGWVPVGEGPDDKFHREAWTGSDVWPDGTYELIGPKVQGNPEHSQFHVLIRHGGARGPSAPMDGGPRDFEGLKQWLSGKDIEGIVWHHPDGRMAKIKLRDFGIKRHASPQG